MDITFTLQSTYTGSTYNAGPFNISGTTCEGTEYILATGVTKNQLITGYTVSTIYETISGGTIASVGTCTTTRNWLTGVNCTSNATHTFVLDCSTNELIAPSVSPPYFYVTIDASQFTVPPTYTTFIKIANYPYYIYKYSFSDNSPATGISSVQVLTQGQFICDNRPGLTSYCYTDNLDQTYMYPSLQECQSASSATGYNYPCTECVGEGPVGPSQGL